MFNTMSLLGAALVVVAVIIFYLIIPEFVRRYRYPLVYEMRRRLEIDLGGAFISIDGKSARSLSLAQLEKLFSSKKNGEICVVKVYQLGDPGGHNHEAEYRLTCVRSERGVSFSPA